MEAALAGAYESREEIRGLIANNQLDRAVRRLMDYARDFSTGRSLENEAVGLSARLNQLAEDNRKFGATTETQSRRAALVSSMLELADQIYEGRTTPQTPSSNLIQGNAFTGLQEEPVPPPTASLRTETEGRARRLTAWEVAREKFFHPQSRAPEERAALSQTAFRCRGLSKRYTKRGRFALEGVDIDLRLGETTGVVGLNGSGKTTLLRLIAGDLAASGGSFEYPALTARDLDWRVARRRIGYVSQEPSPWPSGSVGACLHLQAALAGLYGQENRHEVNFILHRLGLSTYRDHRWNQLSRGFQLRFDLALVLLSRATLLVLDEPLAPLDITAKYLFLQDLRDIARSHSRPMAIILSYQDVSETEFISDHILLIRDGQPLLYLPTRDLGDDRPYNVFELSCSLSATEISGCLSDIVDLKVKDFAGMLIVRVPKAVSETTLLSKLLSSSVKIHFFRDVSLSTRRFFDMEMLER